MTFRRLAAATAAAATLGLGALLAVPASAHVNVDPGSAVQGSYTKLTFRVPNERDVDTTKVAVKLPTDHPIASVSVKPEPGWTYAVTTERLAKPIKTDDGDVNEAVSTITWSGGAIKPGEFMEFEISAGPLPTDTKQLLFPTVQTYTDGQEVAWIDPPAAAGQPEPDHPAPTLTLTAPGSEAAGGSAGTTSSGSSSASPVSVAASPVKKSDVGSASSKAVAGLVVGVVALAVATAALLVGRRRSA